MKNSQFRALRSEAGVTQARVAIRANIDRAKLSMWECGDVSLRTEELDSLEKALGELISEQAARMTRLLSSLESQQVPAD